MADFFLGRPSVVQLRTRFRLRRIVRSLTMQLRARWARDRHTLVTPVRTTHTIHGRSYVIEVRPVARDRWRAQIARAPGGMTSLMPFYGPTAEEAARLLAVWLTRAGGPPKVIAR